MTAAEEAEQWRAWISEVWSGAGVAAAVTLASPVLAGRVERILRGERFDVGPVRRVAESLARYLVRMRGRATPFGLFAGVAPISVGRETTARCDGELHVRAGADVAWLSELIARLESNPALLRRLPVTVNDLLVARGDRLIVPWQPHAAGHGLTSAKLVTLHRKPVVRLVLDAARAPVVVDDLVARVQAEFARHPASAVVDMVRQLVTHGVLITSLRPPSTSGDGLGHLLDRLHAVRAETVPEIAPLMVELRAIHTELAATATATHQPASAGDLEIGEISRRMRALAPDAPHVLAVDARLAAHVILPQRVTAEAEAAAGALLRLSPHPGGHDGWRDYHHRFLDRFGSGALVRVEQLVDETFGLGFPHHYGSLDDLGPAVRLSERDTRLLALAGQAALNGAREVVLDDTIVNDLGGHGQPASAPAHLALCAELHAPSLPAIEQGEFRLLVVGVTRGAVAMTGRFLDLLAQADRNRMLAAIRALPAGVDGALAAQLSFPPRHARTANVIRAPRTVGNIISLAEHHPSDEQVISVRDLAVTADRRSMYLVSLSRRRIVEPIAASAAAAYAMPAMARLLLELPQALTTVAAPFSWGPAAGCLPFLPRVRYGRCVLAPARWHIHPHYLPDAHASRTRWSAALAGVRERLRWPETVQVGSGDRCLRLNLDDAMDLALLRTHFNRTRGAVTVEEAPSPTEYGWFTGRACELVLPLACTTPPRPAPAALTRPGPVVVTSPDHDVLPGSRVLFAKLYGPPDGYSQILTEHLPELLTGWEQPPPWWFVPYRDPQPHLRLRLRLHQPAGDYGPALARISSWTQKLSRLGLVGDLVLDTYHPETPRYGTGPAMASAEMLFAADSAAALAQLTAVNRARGPHPHALTAASLTDLATAMLGSQQAGMRWLIDHPAPADPAPLDRAVTHQTHTLVNDDNAALDGLPGGPEILTAWAARRRAAAAYTTQLTNIGHPRPEQVLVALLHLQNVRVHGINSGTETTCYRLARAVALAWRAHHHTAAAAATAGA